MNQVLIWRMSFFHEQKRWHKIYLHVLSSASFPTTSLNTDTEIRGVHVLFNVFHLSFYFTLKQQQYMKNIIIPDNYFICSNAFANKMSLTIFRRRRVCQCPLSERSYLCRSGQRLPVSVSAWLYGPAVSDR